MTGTSSYNSQLTPVYLLNTEKIGQVVLPFVSIMIFPTSPLKYFVNVSQFFSSSSINVFGWDPCFTKFQQKSRSFLLDLKTMIDWYVVSANFQHNRINQGCRKNARPKFQGIVVLQSKRQCSKKMENLETKLSPTFEKNQDLYGPRDAL